MVQTSLGKVKIPVNPVTPSSQAIIMSQESLSCRNGQTVKSYMLHLSVTCHLQQNVDSIHNGLCNGESGKFIYILTSTLINFLSNLFIWVFQILIGYSKFLRNAYFHILLFSFGYFRRC